MFNRELYTADGREWFEPPQSELKEQESVKIVLIKTENCMYCDRRLAPGTEVWAHYLKRRTWTRISSLSIYGEFSDWGEPEMLGVACIEDCIEIPL